MSKKILVIVLIVIAAAVVIFSLTRKKQDQNTEQPNTQTNQQAQNENKTELNYVDPEKLPEKFPADFPIEQGAEILQNYNSTNNGKDQATRSFYSKKTIPQNYKLYSDYLKSNNWIMESELNLPQIKTINALKSGMRVSVSISQGKNIDGSTVEIVFIFKAN